MTNALEALDLLDDASWTHPEPDKFRDALKLIRAALQPVGVDELRREVKNSVCGNHTPSRVVAGEVVDFLAERGLIREKQEPIEGLREAVERREKTLRTKKAMGHEGQGFYTEDDPIFLAAKRELERQG